MPKYRVMTPGPSFIIEAADIAEALRLASRGLPAPTRSQWAEEGSGETDGLPYAWRRIVSKATGKTRTGCSVRELTDTEVASFYA